MNGKLLSTISRLNHESSMEWIVFDSQLQPLMGRIDAHVFQIAKLALESNVVVEKREPERIFAVPFGSGVVVIRNFMLGREEFAVLIRTLMEILIEQN
ncbi:MAG: hypothetical protein PWP37_163 [Thermotogota bacterium]|nr:hypothetical protein [Thermotogota bacterium]MDK2863971.1 hypothetical protein [Thermotogota bacterium]HCZ06357.1 hypothetical protein [Thermotogota bacterium]